MAYASRALTSTEQHNAHIEKENLAIVFALGKFHTFVYGRHVTVQTDHKPLISIFKKALTSAPRRLQRMLLKLQNYSFDLVFKSSSQVVIADTLSRAFPSNNEKHSPSEKFAEDVASIVDRDKSEEIAAIVASEKVQTIIKSAALLDDVYKALTNQILKGWPDTPVTLPYDLREYFPFCDELTVEGDFIFKGSRLLVPASARQLLTERAHSSHIGVNGCIRRASEAVFWPGMTKPIKDFVSKCSVCAKLQTESQPEPLLPHPTPSRPWIRIGKALFEFRGKSYLICTDYFSNFFEIDRLDNKKAPEIVYRMRHHFARYGIPEVVVSDNGPPFNSTEFRMFAEKYEFQHITSSPRYPQFIGKIENSVKTVKKLLTKSLEAKSDPFLALLD